ncbi:MAG TPA: ferritin-like domain-containing protein [Longimicrobiales bacterium]
MEGRSTQTDAGLVAELNDLLQLDHDAVQAYTIAIDNIEAETLRSTLLEFRGDHERHITDLTRLIREHGGMPIELSHIPTGAFKLAVQKVGAMDGDKGILLAFKANERQVRDKYRRAAGTAGHPPDVAEVLRRNASDEERHYEWAAQALDSMGAGPESLVGRAEGAFERMHERAADAIEGAERRVMERAESARRTMKDAPERMRATTGNGLDAAADAVDRAGTWVESRDGAVGVRVGSMAHGLADSLENAADYIRSRDLRMMRTDLEDRVRVHPLRSAAIAVGAGFLLGRMLR